MLILVRSRSLNWCTNRLNVFLLSEAKHAILYIPLIIEQGKVSIVLKNSLANPYSVIYCLIIKDTSFDVDQN